jgi:hypothetical protein
MTIKQVNLKSIKGLSEYTLNVAHQMGLGKKTEDYWIIPCVAIPSVGDNGINLLNQFIHVALLHNVHTLQIFKK